MLVHAVADIREPLAHLVRLDDAGVGVVEALECVGEVSFRVELEETFAHHGEEHGKVDARVCGAVRGCAWACVEEGVEHGGGGCDACQR